MFKKKEVMRLPFLKTEKDFRDYGAFLFDRDEVAYNACMWLLNELKDARLMAARDNLFLMNLIKNTVNKKTWAKAISKATKAISEPKVSEMLLNQLRVEGKI